MKHLDQNARFSNTQKIPNTHFAKQTKNTRVEKQQFTMHLKVTEKRNDKTQSYNAEKPPPQNLITLTTKTPAHNLITLTTKNTRTQFNLTSDKKHPHTI